MIGISIVTVTFNAQAVIEKTINSVLMQKYFSIEYWIIDGKSTDSTIKIVQSYEKLFKNKGIDYHYISGLDRGIFDAMNKSLYFVTGDYTLFLNAGDFFVDENTILNIFTEVKDTSNDIIYGNYYAYSSNKRKKYIALDVPQLYNKMICSHQSIFTKTELLRHRNYNVEYKMAADYDFYLEMYLRGKKFKKVGIEVIYFDIAGVSQAKAKLTQKERILIQYRQGIINDFEYKKRKKKIKYICLKKKLVKALPTCIRYKSYEYVKVE